MAGLPQCKAFHHEISSHPSRIAAGRASSRLTSGLVPTDAPKFAPQINGRAKFGGAQGGSNESALKRKRFSILWFRPVSSRLTWKLYCYVAMPGSARDDSPEAVRVRRSRPTGLVEVLPTESRSKALKRHFDHIDLRVRRLAEVSSFYETLLPALGFSRRVSVDGWLEFEAGGGVG